MNVVKNGIGMVACRGRGMVVGVRRGGVEVRGVWTRLLPSHRTDKQPARHLRASARLNSGEGRSRIFAVSDTLSDK